MKNFKGHNNQSYLNGSSSLNQYSNNPEKILSIEYDIYLNIVGLGTHLTTSLTHRKCENADIPKDALVNAF
ncbi:hypothetical protein GcM3_045029 [Golovinomyces cichoracearum]|uniref:Uncharacterized protein n=1 Tax=Golovinomyces cichoracearum TaxID=62708 RepID=A0A420J0S4_9PEZI|nr:hypothetical protein GcM3_045029 [Golovinomyces cichoracearum]